MCPCACFLRQGVVWPRGCAAALGKTCARPPALAAKAGARPVVLGIHLLGSKTNVAARRRAFRITAAGGGCPPAAPFRMTGCCPAKALCARRAKAFPGQRGAARQTRPRRGALHAARALCGGGGCRPRHICPKLGGYAPRAPYGPGPCAQWVAKWLAYACFSAAATSMFSDAYAPSSASFENRSSTNSFGSGVVNLLTAKNTMAERIAPATNGGQPRM